MNISLKSPFPYFGNKSYVADEVWKRLGTNVPTYIEPFFGSGAVLLSRPVVFNGVEVVNDISGWITNFWRCVKKDPERLASASSYPISELDLQARGTSLFYKGWTNDNGEFITPDIFSEKMRNDPEYCDYKSASWWIYFQRYATASGSGNVIGKGGERVKWSPPQSGRETLTKEDLLGLFSGLSRRLFSVNILCGDWKRVVYDGRLQKRPCAIFLDPPYDLKGRDKRCYGFGETNVWDEVVLWCKENGSDKTLRIALCGYANPESPVDLFPGLGWTSYLWTAPVGFAAFRKSGLNENRYRDCIWFSSGCLSPDSKIEISVPKRINLFKKRANG